MPKNEINYAKTIIYKIQSSEQPELIYVGHTTDFTRRKNQHKNLSTSEKNLKSNLKVYQTIRANGGWEMFNMVQIKEFPCKNRLEALSEEDKCMTQLKASLNSCKAYTELTPEEYSIQYRDTHKEQKKIVDKQYREQNSEKIKANKKLYRELNKDKIKAHKQEYDERNKEKISLKHQEYYEKNKLKLIEQSAINFMKRKEAGKINQEEINRKQRERRALKKSQLS